MTQHQALTISDLAKRWSVSRQRVGAMIDAGYITGAFVLPSAGRFGRTIKIPMSAVHALEENWKVPTGACVQPQAHIATVAKFGAPRLDHFPELLEATAHDAECLATVQRSNEHTA